MFGLNRKQLDRRLTPLRQSNAVHLGIPVDGWLKTIRTSLGMTLAQLGERAHVSPQSIIKAESSEQQGTISLNTLNHIAQAIDCEIVYFVLPKLSLEDMVETQLRKKAHTMIKAINHTMTLENQQATSDVLIEQLEELLVQLRYEVKIKKNISFIWDEAE